MSAQKLRKAAALMRERAETATPGPWQVGQDVDSGQRFIYDERWTELAEVAEWSRWLGNPEHIASWSPGIAVLVALVLDNHADEHGSYDCQWEEPCGPLQLARAYLGESA
jgi:hypothetical protein